MTICSSSSICSFPLPTRYDFLDTAFGSQPFPSLLHSRHGSFAAWASGIPMLTCVSRGIRRTVSFHAQQSGVISNATTCIRADSVDGRLVRRRECRADSEHGLRRERCRTKICRPRRRRQKAWAVIDGDTDERWGRHSDQGGTGFRRAGSACRSGDPWRRRNPFMRLTSC